MATAETISGANRSGALRNLWLDTERRSLLLLSSLATRLRRTRSQPAHLITGERGEFEALFLLRRHGFLLVEKRWRTPALNGDLDLIGWEGETLCFIEVKTRTARDLTPAASSIDSRKRHMLDRMASAYRRTLPQRQRRQAPFRFDVVSVYLLPTGVECELIRAAFDPNESSFQRHLAT